jgi:hypothetical protein
LTFGLSSTYFLSCLGNLVAICHNIESHTLWVKSSHTHTLHELIVLFSLLCLQGNLCLSYPCLSTICLHNFDMLCDYYLKTGIHAFVLILVKGLTRLLLFPPFSLMFSFSSFPFVCKTCGLYYSVYPSPSETVRGSNFYFSWCLFILFYPLSLCDKKGE